MHHARSITACAATLVLLLGCGTDEPSTAEPAAQEDVKPSDGSEADDAPAESDADPVEDQDGGEQEPDAQSELSSGTAEPGEGGAGGTPQDTTLDLSQRHVGGTVLQVSGIRFEGNTMLLDAEFINGSTREVTIRVSGSGLRLRLLDDVGNTYNFVVPDGEDDRLTLPVGESIGGSFAFLGPVDPAATELTLAVNLYDPVDDYDPAADTYESTSIPPFVLGGIELVR